VEVGCFRTLARVAVFLLVITVALKFLFGTLVGGA
jgi:hypothetical protein